MTTINEFKKSHQLYCIALHCIALYCIVLYCIWFYLCWYLQEGIALGSCENDSFPLLFLFLLFWCYFVVLQCFRFLAVALLLPCCFCFFSACRLLLFDHCWRLLVVVLILVFWVPKTGVRGMVANAWLHCIVTNLYSKFPGGLSVGSSLESGLLSSPRSEFGDMRVGSFPEQGLVI